MAHGYEYASHQMLCVHNLQILYIYYPKSLFLFNFVTSLYVVSVEILNNLCRSPAQCNVGLLRPKHAIFMMPKRNCIL